MLVHYGILPQNNLERTVYVMKYDIIALSRLNGHTRVFMKCFSSFSIHTLVSMQVTCYAVMFLFLIKVSKSFVY